MMSFAQSIALLTGVVAQIIANRTRDEAYKTLEIERKRIDDANIEAVARIEAEKKNQEEQLENAQRAADQHLREQKLEAEETYRIHQEKNKKEREKFEMDVKALKNEHYERMERLRDASMESRQAEEKRHQEELDFMRNKHSKDLEKAAEDQKQAREEGALRIQEARKELKEIDEKRYVQCISYNKEMREIENNHQKERNIFKEAEVKLRQKWSDLKREHGEIEAKEQQSNLDKQLQALQLTHINSSSRSVMKQFLEMTKPIEATRNHLIELSNSCANDSPQSFKAVIDHEIFGIRSQKASFENQRYVFNQFVLNCQNVHADVIRLCNSYKKVFQDLMEADELVCLCNRLPKAIDNSEYSKVKELGDSAKLLSDQIGKVKDELDLQLNQMQKKFIAAPNAQKSINE